MNFELSELYIAKKGDNVYLLKCTKLSSFRHNKEIEFVSLIDNVHYSDGDVTIINPITAYMTFEERHKYNLLKYIDLSECEIYNIIARALKYEQEKIIKDKKELKKILNP